MAKMWIVLANIIIACIIVESLHLIIKCLRQQQALIKVHHIGLVLTIFIVTVPPTFTNDVTLCLPWWRHSYVPTRDERGWLGLRFIIMTYILVVRGVLSLFPVCFLAVLSKSELLARRTTWHSANKEKCWSWTLVHGEKVRLSQFAADFHFTDFFFLIWVEVVAAIWSILDLFVWKIR